MLYTGLHNLITNIDSYRNKNIALVVNHTSVTADLIYSWDILSKKGLRIKRVFTPEHGLFGTEQDQIPVQSGRPEFDFQVISLYGNTFESLIPDVSYFKDIDLVLFDIQDIGTRYYTYVNTMILFMKAVSGHDVEFLVLDRPNPIGGLHIEGPKIKHGYESFVGIIPISVRHGLTVGELALLAKDYYKLDINLKIIKMIGWRRDLLYNQTGLPWIPPSPNMPTLHTAYVYPGLCLIEGLNISEGRGTTTPFNTIGAPFIKPYELAERLNSLGLNGIFFRPVFYKPTFNKFAGNVLGGIYLHITNYEGFEPFLTGIAITKILHDLYEDLEFLKGVYEFNTTYPAFDLLTGSSDIREMILSGESLNSIRNSWYKDEIEFKEYSRKYRIYK